MGERTGWHRVLDGTSGHHRYDAHPRIRNVVWLAGDVHYPQVNAYDPDEDGRVDFYEFISGPLSARAGHPIPPNQDLHPTTLYSDGGFPNFGVIRVAGASLRLAIMDEAGQERFSKTFQANLQETESLEHTREAIGTVSTADRERL